MLEDENAERARRVIADGKITLDTKLAVFTVMGTTENDVFVSSQVQQLPC